jgi:hypothetical protein
MLALATVLGLGTAKADIGTLVLGGNYSGSINGGPIDPSTWNGNALAFVYCIDIPDHVDPGATYLNTLATTTGDVTMTIPDANADTNFGDIQTDSDLLNTESLPVAGAVAWLLDNYGLAAQTTDQEEGLQEAIWQVIYGGPGSTFSGFESPTAGAVTDEATYLTNLGYYNYAASKGTMQTGNVGNYLWFSPSSPCLNTGAGCTNPDPPNQALVGLQVPEPLSTVLLGAFFLAGLLGFAAKRKLA